MQKKWINYFKNTIKYIRRGGVIYTTVTQVNHEDSLKNKKILITGGGSGFGFAIAKKFLSEGALVLITGRNQFKLEKALKDLNSVNVFGLVWDISDISIVKGRLTDATRILNGLDIVINKAGVWTPKHWKQISETEWDDILNINLKGLFFMCQSEAEILRRNKSTGKIINITSIEGIRGGFGPYYASKWGANGLTKGLAKELIEDDIIVNAIAPGMAITDINPSLPKNVEDNAYCPQHRTKRYVLVEEVAELASFLASDSANSIVGQVIAIDGGWTLY
jgi:NAD(P)-dependent dehydrogenase (short-subunit alcohol dehydrogenase family)